MWDPAPMQLVKHTYRYRATSSATVLTITGPSSWCKVNDLTFTPKISFFPFLFFPFPSLCPAFPRPFLRFSQCGPFHLHCLRIREHTLLKREIILPMTCRVTMQSLSAMKHLYKGYLGAVRQTGRAADGPKRS